jgi:hypothetical protein
MKRIAILLPTDIEIDSNQSRLKLVLFSTSITLWLLLALAGTPTLEMQFAILISAIPSLPATGRLS